MCLNWKAKEVYSITESVEALFHTNLFLLLLGIAVYLSIIELYLSFYSLAFSTMFDYFAF